MISVVSGSNFSAIKEYVKKQTKKFVNEHDDLALEKISAEEANSEQIFSAVESVPFLSNKKMVVLEGLSYHKELVEDLDKFFARVNDAVNLIIVETKPDKRSAYYKRIKKLDNFIEFNDLDQASLAKQLINNAKENSADITFANANYLIDRIGQNQLLLEKEILKLAAFDPNITRENIDLLTKQNPQSSIFNLLDSVFSGRLDQSLKLYDEQRAQGVEPSNILGMLAWQLHIVAMISAARGKSNEEISKIGKVNPFVVQKSRSIAEKLGPVKLQQLLDDLVELDLNFKTTSMNQDTALKNLIAKYSN